MYPMSCVLFTQFENGRENEFGGHVAVPSYVLQSPEPLLIGFL